MTREVYDTRLPELAAERLNSRAKKTTMHDRGTSAYALGTSAYHRGTSAYHRGTSAYDRGTSAHHRGTAKQRDEEEHKASAAKGGEANTGTKKLTAEEKKQKILAEDPNFTPRNINELNVKWVSVGHGGKMNGKVAKELFELFSKK